MRKFKQIDICTRKDNLYSVLVARSRHIFGFPVLSSDAVDEKLIRCVLTGIHNINFDAIENRDGTLNFSSEDDFKYISSISNFYFNYYSVDGYYFKDLTALEQNKFKALEVVVTTLRLPYLQKISVNFNLE